jgi:hypothetical protein
VYGWEPEGYARVDAEFSRPRTRSPSPPFHGYDRQASLERPRGKELEKVGVRPYPEITKLMTWKTSLARAVMITANSNNAKGVMQWVSAVWAEGQNYDALGDDECVPFITLDMKLAQGMMIMLNKAGEKASRIRDKVNLKTEEATRNGTLVTGRQLVFMLLESYKTFDRCDLIYGFDHLGTLRVKDHNLHEFLMTWNHIIDNMGKFSLNDLHLRDVFYRKIKDEPEMEFDINNYERMSEHDHHKTYEHLKNCVEKVITVQEQKKKSCRSRSLAGSERFEA